MSQNSTLETAFHFYNANTTNTTVEEPTRTAERYVTLTIAALTICLSFFTILFNGAIIAIFLTNKRVRTTFNYFLINLTVVDLLLGVIAMPFNVAYSIAIVWPFPYAFCTFFWYVDFICTSGTLNAVTLIAMDRFCCVFAPILYRRYMSKRLAISVIAIQWLYLHVLMVPFITIDRLNSTLDDSQCFVQGSRQKTLGLIVQVMAYCLPLALSAIGYLLICLKINLRRTRKRRVEVAQVSQIVTIHPSGREEVIDDKSPEPQQAAVNQQSATRSKENNLYLTLSWLTLCMITCWRPGTAYFTMDAVTDKYNNFFVFSIVVCMEFLTCVINPLVYHHSMPEMKAAVAQLLRCH